MRQDKEGYYSTSQKDYVQERLLQVDDDDKLIFIPTAKYYLAASTYFVMIVSVAFPITGPIKVICN